MIFAPLCLLFLTQGVFYLALPFQTSLRGSPCTMPPFHPYSFFPEATVFSSLRPYLSDVLNFCASREIAWSSRKFFGVCHIWVQVLGMFHLKALSLHFFIIKMVSYYQPGRFVGDQMRQRSWVDLVSYRFPIGFFLFLPSHWDLSSSDLFTSYFSQIQWSVLMNFRNPDPSSLYPFSNQRPNGNVWLCKGLTPFDGCSRSLPSQAPWGQ